MFNKNFKITNTLLYNHTNRNVIHPTNIYPAEQREVSTNVEIIEINNSSDECDENEDHENIGFAHAWSYIGHDLYTDEESYKINEAARERRRLNNEFENTGFEHRSVISQPFERSSEHLYPSFYSLDRSFTSEAENKPFHNRHVNRFTIPNHQINSSSSSDEPNVDIEMIQCGDAITNSRYWNENPEMYDQEIYFSQDHDTDKKTVWIYSYKNRRILSQHDYVLTNITNQESSSYTSSTDELEVEPTKESNADRIATPIPYNIPRLNLNLTSTLPTVTEVSEPIKPIANETNTAKAKYTMCKTSKSRSDNHEKTSPTRRSRNTEEHSKCSQTVSPRSSKYSAGRREINKQSTDFNKKDFVYCEPEVTIITKDDNNIEIYSKDLDPESETFRRVDREDNSVDSNNSKTPNQLPLEKPRIQIFTKPSKRATISDPIEKLEGNWIGDSLVNNEQSILSYTLQNENSNEEKNNSPQPQSIANQFFIRNLPLLKPAEWNEYMPVTDSVPSLEITIDTDIGTSKQSWFNKLLTCVKCFQRNK